MRFTIFANQLGGFAAHWRGRLVEELFQALAFSRKPDLELSLGKPAQEAAARLAIRLRLGIEPVEQVVGH